MGRRHLLLLAAAVTDSTFERTTLDGRPVWSGTCLHCGSKLVVADNGCAMGEATLDHILPQAQGGGNDLPNLAVACAGCTSHDHSPGEAFERLSEKRMARWRDPDMVGMASLLAALIAATDDVD
jgi:5-methylcytosine-specific restriction endonuclease McrA